MIEPKLTLEQVQERVEQNANQNRVTKQTIEARIQSSQYWLVGDSTLTICILTIKNGFTFVGKSACADPANFDKEVGERYAYEDAFKQIWSHEAYLIRERLSQE